MHITWPSLYNPGLEILNIQQHSPVQPKAHYLYDSRDVVRFTIYWSLIFNTPIFFLYGLYAFLNDNSALHRPTPNARSQTLVQLPQASQKSGRESFALAVLVGTVCLVLSFSGIVLGSVVIGYVLVVLFRAGHYNMSTWVPLLWAGIQALLNLLGLWPSVIDII